MSIEVSKNLQLQVNHSQDLCIVLSSDLYLLQINDIAKTKFSLIDENISAVSAEALFNDQCKMSALFSKDKKIFNLLQQYGVFNILDDLDGETIKWQIMGVSRNSNIEYIILW